SCVSMKYFIGVSPSLGLIVSDSNRRRGTRGSPGLVRLRSLYIHHPARRHGLSPDLAAGSREQLQRSADAAYALLAEHLARPLLGPAPRGMGVLQQPAPARRHTKEVRTSILGRAA